MFQSLNSQLGYLVSFSKLLRLLLMGVFFIQEQQAIQAQQYKHSAGEIHIIGTISKR